MGAALITGLSACGGGNSSNTSKVVLVSFDEMTKEYQDSVNKLSWPAGYTPPASLETEGKDNSFQVGYGDGIASRYFECAWEREWLKSYSTDKARAATAIEQLEKVPEMDHMSAQNSDDATRRFFADYLKRAKLGDPSGFQENVSLNCPK
ncbi:hypothetical protein BM477_01290 [Boudabousia marimammalium]|uniref:Uncharacterized protein n=1 Tax=Boudabousia marimammalium TaxID=156892 RepID=A0A1Q5PT17_9ACTO|nr:hypothetical protein BM477_01290 [Boudabousia marimammalium]